MAFIESVGVLLPAPKPTGPEEVASAPNWEGYDADAVGFGRWLAALRRNAKLTQKQLGAASGHINVYISKIENGVVKPRPDVARGICLALGVSDALWEQVRAHFFAPADVTPANYRADAVGFGSWMAALRRNAGVTQERLGAASGHINVYISKIENGAMPSVFIAYGLCVSLDLQPELRAEGLRWFYGDRVRLLSTDTRDHLAFGFGSWLAALRHNVAMTQEGLASTTGYQPGYISEIENGDFVPRRRIARDLCVAMGASAALVEESLLLFDEYRLIDATADNHTLASWLRAHLHNADLNRTELATAAGLSRWYVREIARGESTPLLGTFRRLCDALNVHGPARFEAVRRFYGDRYSIRADPDEERDFWRLVGISVDSRQEEEQRNRIYERYDYDRIAKDAARRWARTWGDRDDLEQVARTAILKAMGHHTPTAPFIAHAVASARGAVRSFYFEHRYLGLEPRTRRIVVVVRAYLGGVDSARPTPDAAEIASALRLNRADVTEALQILSQRSVLLDEPVAGRHGGDIQREVADPTATAAFEDSDLVDSVRAALAGLAEPDTATRLVLAHWVEGTPLDQAAPQLGLSAQAAAEVIAAAVPLLRTAFQPPSSDHAATPDDAPAPPGQDAAPAIAEYVLEAAQVLSAGVPHAPRRVRLVGRRIGFDQFSEATPLTRPILAERIDRLISDDVKALRQFRAG